LTRTGVLCRLALREGAARWAGGLTRVSCGCALDAGDGGTTHPDMAIGLPLDVCAAVSAELRLRHRSALPVVERPE